MDGGSGLNILYIDTLDTMRIPRSKLCQVGSPFHGVILGAQAYMLRPSYAKFMVIPNYTYLKLKMPGLNDVITVSSTFSHAFTCDREHYELATAVVNSTELPWLGESSIPVVPNCNEPTSSTAFRPLEETKAVGVDPTDPAKTPSDMPSILREVTEHALCLIPGLKPPSNVCAVLTMKGAGP
ncbi:uncharacterized protein [Miscanthus floridulus]|uniref:uncharacterized protein n=1 Tax=Miscanthus floridulus TaxID=154761 RepID=UPI003458BE2F